MTEMVVGYEYKPGNMLLLKIRPCPGCGKPHEIKVNEYTYERWADGLASIEEFSPPLSIAERELLLSAICGECFDKMRREEER